MYMNKLRTADDARKALALIVPHMKKGGLTALGYERRYQCNVVRLFKTIAGLQQNQVGMDTIFQFHQPVTPLMMEEKQRRKSNNYSEPIVDITLLSDQFSGRFNPHTETSRTDTIDNLRMLIEIKSVVVDGKSRIKDNLMPETEVDDRIKNNRDSGPIYDVRKMASIRNEIKQTNPDIDLPLVMMLFDTTRNPNIRYENLTELKSEASMHDVDLLYITQDKLGHYVLGNSV